MTDDLELPEDTRPSRLDRPVRSETPDDPITAGERIRAFWKKHPDGRIHTDVERDVHMFAGRRTEVFTVSTAVYKNGDSATPDATAHATRATDDPDEITAQFPQETAETASISRAIRNLGIEPTKRRSKP